MAKTTKKFNPWAVLLIGIVLGAIGYFFYQHSFASGGVSVSQCHGGGGEVDLVRNNLICSGGIHDGASIVSMH